MQLSSFGLLSTVFACLSLVSACGGGAADTAPTEGSTSAAQSVDSTEVSAADVAPDAVALAAAPFAGSPAAGASFVVVQRAGGANFFWV